MTSKRSLAVYTILAINLLLWICLELTGGSQNTQNLMRFGGISYLEISSGQYWRLLAAMFLHIGAAHLAVNGLSLLIMGGMVEKTFGHIRFIAIYLISGLGGSAFSFWMIHPFAIGAGASGAVFGCVGALGAFFLIRRRELGQLGKQNLNAILILAGINFAFGFIMPGIDNWAHLGGFLTGILTGSGLIPVTLGTNRFGVLEMKHIENVSQSRSRLGGPALLGLAVLLIAVVILLANNKTIVERL